MGLSQSKDQSQRDYIAERLQECFNEHGKILNAIEETTKAQTSAVDLLTKLESSKQPDSTEEHNQDHANHDRKILSRIQGILMLQCDIVKTNFKHLKLCLLDAVAEEKDLAQKWPKLLSELSNNDYHSESTMPSQLSASAPGTQLSKYSTENIDEETESVKTTIDKQHQKEVNYQSKKEVGQYNKEHQKELDAKDGEIKKLQKNLDSNSKQHQKTLNAKEDEIKKLKTELAHLRSYSTSLNELQAENADLKREIWLLKTRNQLLEEEMKKKVKPKVPLQLYYLRNDDLMMTVVHELDTMLKTQMSLHDVVVDIQCRTQASDIQPDIPVLALCINASRLGTDAASAISGLRSTHQIALLIFHHKDMHAVPTQKSERMLTGQEFKDLGGIFDLVFLRGKGIYACDLNNEALRSIARFMKG